MTSRLLPSVLYTAFSPLRTRDFLFLCLRSGKISLIHRGPMRDRNFRLSPSSRPPRTTRKGGKQPGRTKTEFPARPTQKKNALPVSLVRTPAAAQVLLFLSWSRVGGLAGEPLSSSPNHITPATRDKKMRHFDRGFRQSGQRVVHAQDQRTVKARLASRCPVRREATCYGVPC